MLLDPFEEELDLPSRLVELRDRERRQREVVREKAEVLVRGWVDEMDAPQRAWVVSSGIGGGAPDDVVGEKSGREVDGARAAAAKANPSLDARDEERRFVGEPMQPREVEVAAVHDVDRTGLQRQRVEKGHVGAFSFGDIDDRRDHAAQVHLRVHLDRAVVSPIPGPGKHRQTELDDRRVERIHGVREFEAQGFIDVERARRGDESLREVRIDTPVACLVGFGEGRPRHAGANPDVIQLGLHRAETRFDVAQAFSIGELGERHAKELVPAREARRLVVTVGSGRRTS